MSLYKELSEYIDGGRNKTHRPWHGKGHTYVYRQDGVVRLVYHDTPVVTVDENDNITLCDGGWKTMTTKDRMNYILNMAGYTLWQNRGFWYISKSSPTWEERERTSVLYFDGMTLPQDFRQSKKAEREKARVTNLRKLIALYVKKLGRLIQSKKFDAPGPGDCFHCLGMFGESDKDHLLSHLQEGYVVPSLVLNAMRDNGFSDIQIQFQWGAYLRWKENGEANSIATIAFPDIAKRSTRRYLCRSLGLAR